ncbi:MAG: polysaccharide biosynthesis C-terminal domain-containing protein, partial [Marinoscillum sp.]
IAIGYFCLGGYKIFSMSLFYEKRIWLISSITGSSAVVNLILNYVLIKKLGVIGVAIATTSSMFMMMILTFILAQRIHPLPWFNLKRES